MLDKISINREMLPMKAHYFLWNAGTGPVTSFMSTYARQLGYSSKVVGTIYLVLPIFGMFVKPLLGALGDKFNGRKAIFLAAQLITAASYLAVFYSPQIEMKREMNVTCFGGGLVLYAKDRSDNCTIYELTKSSDVDECEVVCDSDDAIWREICSNWDPTYCDPSKRSSTVNFTAYVPVSRIYIDDTDVYFPIGNVSFAGALIAPVCGDFTSPCSVTCGDYALNDLITDPAIADADVTGYYEFWVLLLFLVTYWGAMAIAVSVADAICFEMLGDKPHRFGYQRMYGSIGWGIFSSLTGFMIDSLSRGRSQKDYTSAFYMAAAFLVVDFFVSSRLKHTQRHKSPSITLDVLRLALRPRVLLYVFWSVSMGVCMGLFWQYLFWHVEDLALSRSGCEHKDWIGTIQGLVQAIQCLLGELPFLLLSSKILKRFGQVRAMSLAMLCMGARLCLHSVVSDPWLTLPIELLSGPAMGLMYACLATYASKVAPPGTEATVQGLAGAFNEGVGVSLGSYVGGQLYDVHGGALTFRYFGFFMLAACAAHSACHLLIRCQGKQSRGRRGDKANDGEQRGRVAGATGEKKDSGAGVGNGDC